MNGMGSDGDDADREKITSLFSNWRTRGEFLTIVNILGWLFVTMEHTSVPFWRRDILEYLLLVPVGYSAYLVDWLPLGNFGFFAVMMILFANAFAWGYGLSWLWDAVPRWWRQMPRQFSLLRLMLFLTGACALCGIAVWIGKWIFP